jgi:hypothetical protein
MGCDLASGVGACRCTIATGRHPVVIALHADHIIGKMIAGLPPRERQITTKR